MTQQADCIYIKEISYIMIERLAYIKIKPDHIINIGGEQDALQAIYPDANFNQKKKADLIFAILTSETEDISIFLNQWKENLKANGLLLFGFLNINFELRDIGDFLVHLGFVDVVMDKEMLSPEHELICGHAWMPMPSKPISIPVSAITK
jgi:hypothetical protein